MKKSLNVEIEAFFDLGWRIREKRVLLRRNSPGKIFFNIQVSI